MKDSILLFLVVFPIISAFISYLIGRKNKMIRDHFVSFVCLVDLFLMIFILINVINGKQYDFYLPNVCGMTLHLEVDGFRAIYATICAFMWSMTSLFSHEYFHHYRNRNRYFFFLLLTFAGTMGVFLSGSLYTTFIFFEIMSVASYVSVVHDEKPAAMRAGDTYLMIAVLGGMVMLMGLFLLYHTVGTLEIDNLNTAVTTYLNNNGNVHIIWAAALCMLFGFGAKAGMYPVHIWLPKAHPVAPAPASALLSGILTKSGVYGILIITSRIFLYNAMWGKLILTIAVITMFLGAFLALFSVDLKRTLACSSMSQIGFILVGVGMQALLGEHNALAVRGTLLHMVNHSLLKLDLFMCAGAIYMNLHKLNLNDIRGFGKGKPLLNFIFLMGVLGIIGMPLWNGYISKTLLHESIVEYIEILEEEGLSYGIYKFVEWIFLISGGLTAAYMTKLYICIFCEKNNDDAVQLKYNNLNKKYMTKESSIALFISAIVLPILGFSSLKFIPQSMNGIADVGQAFMHGHSPEHAVNYLSLTNLKGGVISLVIGALVYICIVRTLLMKKTADGKTEYVNRWPKYLDLEDYLYRPVIMVGLVNVCSFIFRILDKFIDGLVSIIKSIFFVAIKTYKSGDVFAVLNTEQRTSKVIKEVTNSLSFSLILFCIGLIVALIYLLFV